MRKIEITGPRQIKDGWVIDINIDNRIDQMSVAEFDTLEEALSIFSLLTERIKTGKLSALLD